jgi:hypothetical protein
LAVRGGCVLDVAIPDMHISLFFQKYRCSLKSLLQKGISQPVVYGDLIYKLKKIKGDVNFST